MLRRRRRPTIEDGTPPIDMTPMIDCVFLLLIFFLLTSRFTPDEKQIASLLPAEGPTRTAPPQPLAEKIVIALWPEGFDPAAGEPALDRAVTRWRAAGARGGALLRVGGSEPIRLAPTLLGHNVPDAEAAAALQALHAALAAELERRETPVATRAEAPRIEIHAFSGLPWGYALVVFDAIRAFEAGHGAPAPRDRGDLALARAVAFAAPPVRNGSTHQDGTELWEMMRRVR